MTHIANRIGISDSAGISPVEKTRHNHVYRYRFGREYDRPPAVFITPFAGTGYYNGDCPTIVEITEEYVEIFYTQMAAGCSLNILVVEATAESVASLPVTCHKMRKEGWTTSVRASFGTSRFALVSPYWRQPSPQAVNRIDTLVTGFAYINPNLRNQLTVYSGSSGPGPTSTDEILAPAADGFFVNVLQSIVGCGDRIQTGHQMKGGGGPIRIYFPEPWVTPPVVMVSPWWVAANDAAGTIEMVTRVTTEYFEVSSSNHWGIETNPEYSNTPYFVNWMALAPSGPQNTGQNFACELSDTHIDEGLKLLGKDFGDHAQTLANNNSAIKAAIRSGNLTGLGHIVGKKPSMVAGNRSRFTADPESIAIAQIAFDSIAVFASIFGLTIAARADILEKIAEGIEEASQAGEAAATEVTALVDDIHALARDPAEVAANARALAKNVFVLVAGLWRLGIVKTVLTLATEGMSYIQWIVFGVRLYAQIGLVLAATVLTDGAAAPFAYMVYVARVAIILCNSYSLTMDVLKLEDIRSGNTPNPAGGPEG